jgi:hypothetical protein
MSPLKQIEPALRPSLILMLVAAVAVLLRPLPAWAQYSVNPVIVQLAAGDTAESRTIEVRNEGTRALQLRLYAADFEQAPEGRHTYLTWGEHERSCHDRLSVTPDIVSVPPGESRPVRLRMEPGTSGPTCWSMVFVESPSRTQTGVFVNLRVGVKVYGLTGSPSLDGELAAAEVKTGEQAPALSFAFRNNGDWPLRPEGEIEIRRFDGELVRTISLEAFSVLPQHTRRLTIQLPETLEAGRYLAVPILDYGGEYLAGSQVAFRLP